MSRKLEVTVALIVILITSALLVKSSSGFTSDVKVGLYYYVWYTGNKPSDVVDDPFVQWQNYWSNDSKLIKKHLWWFNELGLDFIIVSWWGMNSFTMPQEQSKFIDNSTRAVFETLKSENSKVEIAIMVEPFNETGTYNFTQIYDYIYNEYVTCYDNYMRLYDKPLLLIFNGNITKDGKIQYDNRFEIRIVGRKFNPYIDWEYEVPAVSEQPLCRDGEISVIPRYDAHGWKCDITYSEGLYDKQWNKVLSLARQGAVKIVTIISWSEFMERTAIEPHYDATAYDPDHYFLYDKTKKYINKLKGEPSCSFVDFVKEIFEDVTTATDYRYDAKDNQGCGLHAIKIIENPEGGYIGVYHFTVGGIDSQFYQVRLANSTDLLHWNFSRTIEYQASQPTIARAPNDAYIVAFDKHIKGNSSHWNHSLGFHYYPNLTSLLEHSPELNFTVPHTLGNISGLEGTLNIYNITIEDSELLRACVGFHYNNGSLIELGWDRVAVGWLNISLNPPRNPRWGEVRALIEYNKKLEQINVKGHIGDRDYGQIFGGNFTLQEANLLSHKENVSDCRYWSSWRIFLYDHSKENFTKLNIRTHFNAMSIGNPTFTFLGSPNEKPCIVVTYFLFIEGLPTEYGNKSGELIFYKEFKTEPFNLTCEDKLYSINVTSNSTISRFNFSESERSINFSVSGLEGSMGYCIVKLPNTLTKDLWRGSYTILFDSKPWPFENWTAMESTYIYTNYLHSEHKITIIPEFLSLLVPSLFMIATPLAVMVYKRKPKTKP